MEGGDGATHPGQVDAIFVCLPKEGRVSPYPGRKQHVLPLANSGHFS